MEIQSIKLELTGVLLLTHLIYYLHRANSLALPFPECTLMAKYKALFFNVKTDVEGEGGKSCNYLLAKTFIVSGESQQLQPKHQITTKEI